MRKLLPFLFLGCIFCFSSFNVVVVKAGDWVDVCPPGTYGAAESCYDRCRGLGLGYTGCGATAGSCAPRCSNNRTFGEIEVIRSNDACYGTGMDSCYFAFGCNDTYTYAEECCCINAVVSTPTPTLTPPPPNPPCNITANGSLSSAVVGQSVTLTTNILSEDPPGVQYVSYTDSTGGSGNLQFSGGQGSYNRSLNFPVVVTSNSPGSKSIRVDASINFPYYTVDCSYFFNLSFYAPSCTNCSTGCCQGTTCNTGNTNGSCGTLGETCKACSGTSYCDLTTRKCVTSTPGTPTPRPPTPTPLPVCDNKTCSTGCCTKYTQGSCLAGTDNTACGKNGNTCQPCATGGGLGSVCVNQVCSNPPVTKTPPAPVGPCGVEQEDKSGMVINPSLGGVLSGATGIGYFKCLLPGLIGLGFVVGAVAFVLMMVVGGIQMILSGGDKMAVEAARSRVTHAAIGLIVLLSTLAITMFFQTAFGVHILTLDLGLYKFQ